MSISEIVVGIDFGTTHSGVSWAVNGGSKKVELISNWPNPAAQNSTADKVPTVISYQNSRVKSWGYDTMPTDYFRWFKILLDPSNKYIGRSAPAVASQRLMNNINKSAQDVAADYLRTIWEYTKEDIQRTKGPTWESIYDVRVVLTVPAIWSPVAKDKTIKAAKAAGLPSDLTLVTEPEAAALAVLKDAAEEPDHNLEVGDAFVVCDAGGGTVDLISYKIQGTDPLRIAEAAVGDGGLCGSVFLDTAFEKYIKTLVGERAYDALPAKSKKRMLKEFEWGVKRCYTGDNKEFSVDLVGVEDNPAAGIIDDTITLKPTALKTIFDHVCNQIVALVEKQIDEVQDRGLQVKAVLLVGGFGSSKYLHKRLQSSHNGDGINVLQVTGAWSSICRGATMWGLENATPESTPSSPSTTPKPQKTITSRLARYSYGICCAKPFDPSKHRLSDRILDPAHGQYRAINQMSWLLKVGDQIEEGGVLHTQIYSSVQVGFFTSGVKPFSQELFYCGAKDPPSRRERSVHELCSVEYAIECTKLWLESSYKNPVTKQKWRDATFDLFILLGGADLKFAVFYRGEPVAYTQAKYKEDF